MSDAEQEGKRRSLRLRSKSQGGKLQATTLDDWNDDEIEELYKLVQEKRSKGGKEDLPKETRSDGPPRAEHR